MKTIDFRKESAYKAKPEPQIVDVPKMQFVMVDGSGAPENNQQFVDSMAILYGIVYTIKFWDKKHPAPKDYAKFTLTPLEALWWQTDNKLFDNAKLDDWRWTVMIRLPEFVTSELFMAVVNELIEKKESDMYMRARLETFTEGTCAQLLHIGPYDKEEPNILKLHNYAKEAGYQLSGKHHELYFSDPRRTAPEKLKTIIRQPVKKGVTS